MHLKALIHASVALPKLPFFSLIWLTSKKLMLSMDHISRKASIRPGHVTLLNLFLVAL